VVIDLVPSVSIEDTLGILVRHADAGSRTHHEQLGFADGGGTVTAQLAALTEAQEGHR